MLRRFTITTALLGAIAALWAGQALADTTIGHAGGNTSCGLDLTLIQTTPGYTVPAGNWILNSWSIQADGSGGQAAVFVVRPTGVADQYLVVGASSAQGLTPSALNTFTTAISVEPGDLLGVWATAGTLCAQSGSGSDNFSEPAFNLPVPTAGSTLSVTNFSGYLMNISATLTPAGADRKPDSMFVCYSKWEQDGGAVFPTDRAEQLLASGWWLPTAVPGTVAGGDNLRGYHLECNPPNSWKATGQWVDGGGGVLDRNPAGIGWYAIKTGS